MPAMTEASFERPRDPVIAVHTSDLHLGANPLGRGHDGASALEEVVAAAHTVGAHVLLLAGDIFDHNRVPEALVDETASVLADSEMTVLILPGNHDPATDDSVYRRGIADAANVHVFGVTTDSCIDLPSMDLEVTGKPHVGYEDMRPLHEPHARSRRRRIVMAHGHWLTGSYDSHRSWLIHDDDLAALDADYVALGHWDLAQRAGDERSRAYYSGSPRYSGSVNVVRFDDGVVDVRRLPLRAGVAEEFPTVMK
jgi:DNA repair exonuclease SbcCD nuclease subunit